MERAPHPVQPPPPVEEHHPQPIPRDPDLPTISERALMLFAAAALVATLAAVVLLL